MAVQEICSFLKGSAEAMDTDNGKLSLSQYLEASLASLACYHCAVLPHSDNDHALYLHDGL